MLILTDKKDQNQYKSIFIKKENRLKVVDFNNGLLINQQLNTPANGNAQELNVSKRGQGNGNAVKNNQHNRNNYQSNRR